MTRLLGIALALLCGSAAELSMWMAQGRPGLRGAVLQPDERTPAEAVLIELRDSTLKLAGSAVTDARGTFFVPLTSGGRFTLRALRVGYRPTVVNELVITDSIATVRVVLASAAVRIAAARVTTPDVCGVNSDSGGVVGAAWNQVRTALLTAATSTPVTAQVARWESVRPLDAERLVWQSLNERELMQPKGDAALGDTSHGAPARPGPPAGASDYFGPDADRFLSDDFAADHCFRLVPPLKDRPAWVGVAFRPIVTGRSPVELAGTFWMDTAGAALRVLEYRFPNASPDFTDAGAGGRIEFDRLQSGEWLVRRWTMRVPIADNDWETRRVLGQRWVRPADHALIRVTGGSVISVSSDRGLRPADSQLRIRVVTRAGQPARNAHVEFLDAGLVGVTDSSGVVTIDDPPTGNQRVASATAAMRALVVAPARGRVQVTSGQSAELSLTLPTDDQILTNRCGSAAASSEIVAYGQFPLALDGTAPSGVVSLAWLADRDRQSAAAAAWIADSTAASRGEPLSRRARSDAIDRAGRWAVCGVPRGSTILAVLSGPGGARRTTWLRVPAEARLLAVPFDGRETP
jgi:hypothetical protein